MATRSSTAAAVSTASTARRVVGGLAEPTAKQVAALRERFGDRTAEELLALRGNAVGIRAALANSDCSAAHDYLVYLTCPPAAYRLALVAKGAGSWGQRVPLSRFLGISPTAGQVVGLAALRTQLTPHQVARVLALHDVQCSITDIAAVVGVSAAQAKSVVRQFQLGKDGTFAAQHAQRREAGLSWLRDTCTQEEYARIVDAGERLIEGDIVGRANRALARRVIAAGVASDEYRVLAVLRAEELRRRIDRGDSRVKPKTGSPTSTRSPKYVLWNALVTYTARVGSSFTELRDFAERAGAEDPEKLATRVRGRAGVRQSRKGQRLGRLVQFQHLLEQLSAASAEQLLRKLGAEGYMATAEWLRLASLAGEQSEVAELVESAMLTRMVSDRGPVKLRADTCMSLLSAFREHHGITSVKNRLPDGSYKRGAVSYAGVEEAVARLYANPPKAV